PAHRVDGLPRAEQLGAGQDRERLFLAEGGIQSLHAHLVAWRGGAVLRVVPAAVPGMAAQRRATLAVTHAVPCRCCRVACLRLAHQPARGQRGSCVLPDTRPLLAARVGGAAVPGDVLERGTLDNRDASVGTACPAPERRHLAGARAVGDGPGPGATRAFAMA